LKETLLRKPGSKTLGQVLECNNEVFIDFLKQCFVWEPEKRLTPKEALKHDWILQTTKRNKLKLESIKLSLGKLPIPFREHYATERTGLMKLKEKVKAVAASQLLQGMDKCNTVKDNERNNILYSIFSTTKIKRADTNK